MRAPLGEGLGASALTSQATDDFGFQHASWQIMGWTPIGK